MLSHETELGIANYRDPTEHYTAALSAPASANQSRLATQPLSLQDSMGFAIVIIEHNLDVIKTADWLIDMGPEGGAGGGTVLGEGTPEQLAKNEASFTGKYLQRLLNSAQ